MMALLPLAATIPDAAGLAEELSRQRILAPDRLESLLVEFAGAAAGEFAEFLVARGELTPFQAERTLLGAGKSLTLGPYRLLGPHHVGSFGPIFSATKAGQRFAVRVLPLRSLWQAKQAKQLVRSLAAWSAHSALVPLVDADSASGSHYLVWPLVEGELLSDRVVSSGPLSPAEATQLLARLAAGLAALHARQTVHGLFTPHSVLLATDGSPRLLEVGAGMLLARNLAVDGSLFDTLSTAIAVAGAFDYAAPEWIANPSNPTAAGDQYSLGAVGYFALTGSPPPAAEPIVATSIPAALAELLNRLLQVDPAARFTAMDEVREVLAQLGGVATPPPVAEPGRELPDRLAEAHTDSSPSVGWQPATPSDGAEASVQFELPAVEELAAVNGVAPAFTAPNASAKAAPPAQWTSAALPQHSAAAAPPRGSSKIAPPPVLPAAPLPASEPGEKKVSGSWSVVAAHTGSRPIVDTQQPAPVLWKRMKQKVLFWQEKGDTVQISVFGPPAVARSQTPKLTVFLHSPAATVSVATLARAFHHDAVLLGSSSAAQAVTRGWRVAVHLAAAHLAVANPLRTCNWQGQPHRLDFELVVPWEAPTGPAHGVASIGRDDVRIGKVEFVIPILGG
jgi:serine/threonine protein kinase